MSNVHSILRDPRFIKAGIAMHRLYDGGVSIIEEESGERELYLIESGCVRIHERIELEAQRHIQPGICDLGAGEVFGELSLYESGPRLSIYSPAACARPIAVWVRCLRGGLKCTVSNATFEPRKPVVLAAAGASTLLLRCTCPICVAQMQTNAIHELYLTCTSRAANLSRRGRIPLLPG